MHSYNQNQSKLRSLHQYATNLRNQLKNTAYLTKSDVSKALSVLDRILRTTDPNKVGIAISAQRDFELGQILARWEANKMKGNEVNEDIISQRSKAQTTTSSLPPAQKPQQQRSIFQNHINDTNGAKQKVAPASSSPKNTAAELEKDIEELENSGLLTREESSILCMVQLNAVIISSDPGRYVAHVAKIKQDVAKRAERKKADALENDAREQEEKRRLLARCSALKQSGKLTLEDEDELIDIVSGIEKGAKNAGTEQLLMRLEGLVAARKGKIDVNFAIKELLKPENERYMIEHIESVRGIARMREAGIRLAEDWARDMVCYAYEDLKRIEESMAQAGPGSKRMELIQRVQGVLFSGMELGLDGVELKASLFNLLRVGVDWGGLDFLEKMLARNERKMAAFQFNKKISDLQIALMMAVEKDVHDEDNRLEQAYYQLSDLRFRGDDSARVPESQIMDLSRIEEKVRPILKEYGLAVGADGQVLHVPAEPRGSG